MNKRLLPSWALNSQKIPIDGANSLPTPLLHTHTHRARETETNNTHTYPHHTHIQYTDNTNYSEWALCIILYTWSDCTTLSSPTLCLDATDWSCWGRGRGDRTMKTAELRSHRSFASNRTGSY